MAAWRWPGDCASWRGRSPGAPRCERNVSGATTEARGGSETFRDVTPGPIEQQQGRRHEVRQQVQGRQRGGRQQQQVRRQEQEQGRQQEVRRQEQEQGRQREGNRKRARLGPLHEEIGAVVEKFEIAPKVLRTEYLAALRSRPRYEVRS